MPPVATGYELATAYVNLVVSTDDTARQIGQMFKGVDKDAATGGTAAGKAFAKAFDKADPIDLKAEADKAAAQVEVASKKVEKARDAEEAAARKVAIEEAKLAEQRASGSAKASTILQTEDRLARAKDRAAVASENVSTAIKAEADAKTRATAKSDQYEAAQRDAGRAADQAGQEFVTLKDRMQAALRGDFKGAFKSIPKDADSAADKVEDRFEDAGQESSSAFGDAFKGALAGLAAYVSFDAIVDGFKAVMEESGNLEQSVGAIDSVFKDNAAQMHTWAGEAAVAVGLSKNEFNELGTLLGAQLKNAGTPMKDLAGDTNELIGLGADLASMFGGTTAEAVEAISSALKGERDPIEKYGVSLKQASIDAKAAEMGFSKVGGSFDQNAQAAATVALIMDQTADAQGNFAAESDTLAHKQQVAAAQWSNLKSTIGEAFLPVLTNVMGTITDHVIPAFESMAGGVKSVMDFMSEWKAVLVPVGMVLGGVALALGVYAASVGIATLATNLLQSATWKATAAFLASPLGWLVIAIGAVVGALVWFFTQTELGGEIWGNIWSGIKTAAAAVVDWFQNTAVPIWNTVMEALGTALNWVWSNILQPVFQAIGALAVWLWENAIQPAFGFIVALWNNVLAPALTWLGGLFATIFTAIGTAAVWMWNNVLKPTFNFLVAFWQTVLAPTLTWLWGVFQAIFSFIGALIKAWWNNVLKPTFNFLIAFWKNVLSPTLTWLWGVFKSIFNFIAALIKAWWNFYVKPIFNAVKAFIENVLAPAFQWFWNSVIKPVWNGIKRTIENVWNNGIKPIFQALGDFIEDKVAPAFESGVDAIAAAWEGLKEAAKAPVRFVVNKVINEGVVDRFNDIAGHFPGTTEMPHLKLPKGFRAGGKVWGAGTETSDSIPAMLSKNEHVLTAKDVRNFGGHGAVYRMRAMAAHGAGKLKGLVPGLKNGGTLSDAARWLQSHGVRITEFKAWGQRVGKHSNGSLHYSGRAFDANAGPGGENATEKAIFDRLVPQLNQRYPKLRTLWRVPGHHNHLHVDTGRGGSVGSGGPGAGGGGFDLLGMFLKPFNALKEKLNDQFEKFGKFGSLAKGMGRKAINIPIDWIKENVGDALGDVWEGAKETAATGSAKVQARAWATANNIPWGGARMSALRWIIGKESSWNPRAQNPSTTASGLPQFVNGTARQYMGVAPAKNYSVWKQLDGMMKYVNDRYGGAVPAKAFWQRNNYYAQGGAVIPKYDNGGLLHRGVQLVNHQSPKPDRVLTAQQWDGIYQAATGGGQQPIIQVTTPVVERNEVEDWVDEVQFAVTHMSKTGAFSGVNG